MSSVRASVDLLVVEVEGREDWKAMRQGTREKLAESIIPAAIAFEAPSQKSEGLLHMSSGTAPSPVDSAVIHP